MMVLYIYKAMEKLRFIFAISMVTTIGGLKNLSLKINPYLEGLFGQKCKESYAKDSNGMPVYECKVTGGIIAEDYHYDVMVDGNVLDPGHKYKLHGYITR